MPFIHTYTLNCVIYRRFRSRYTIKSHMPLCVVLAMMHLRFIKTNATPTPPLTRLTAGIPHSVNGVAYWRGRKTLCGWLPKRCAVHSPFPSHRKHLYCCNCHRQKCRCKHLAGDPTHPITDRGWLVVDSQRSVVVITNKNCALCRCSYVRFGSN